MSGVPSPLNAIVQDAARKLANLRMARVIGEPDPQDALALRDDLEAIWRIVDPMIEQIGEYAQSTLGISDSDLREFKGQLEGALDGNATYVLERKADELREARMEFNPMRMRRSA